jgi:hypothetical protein
MEAIQDIFHRIPFGEEITFSDGRKGTLQVYFEPRIFERAPGHEDLLHQRPTAGIDISGDGWHLEFMLVQTGWGGEP